LHFSSNFSIFIVPGEVLCQKRAVRTKLDIYLFLLNSTQIFHYEPCLRKLFTAIMKTKFA